MTEREQMLVSILNCSRTALYADPVHLTSEQEGTLNRMLERRQQNEPLQYILRGSSFMGLDLFVDERVLIPRPETELLVEHVCRQVSHRAAEELNILDLGTGSGNIAISLAKNFSNSHVIAVDISSDALEISQRNACQHKVDSQIEFVQDDLRRFVCEPLDRYFDIVVSNPPYIPRCLLKELPLDVQKEPRISLEGGKDGLRYFRPIIEQSPRLLKSGGILILELGDGQSEFIGAFISQQTGFSRHCFVKDYRGTKRIAVAQID